MAKARDIPGFDGRKSFGATARAAAIVRAEELFDHAAGVLDMDDIDPALAAQAPHRSAYRGLGRWTSRWPLAEAITSRSHDGNGAVAT